MVAEEDLDLDAVAGRRRQSGGRQKTAGPEAPQGWDGEGGRMVRQGVSGIQHHCRGEV